MIKFEIAELMALAKSLPKDPLPQLVQNLEHILHFDTRKAGAIMKALSLILPHVQRSELFIPLFLDLVNDTWLPDLKCCNVIDRRYFLLCENFYENKIHNKNESGKNDSENSAIINVNKNNDDKSSAEPFETDDDLPSGILSGFFKKVKLRSLRKFNEFFIDPMSDDILEGEIANITKLFLDNLNENNLSSYDLRDEIEDFSNMSLSSDNNTKDTAAEEMAPIESSNDCLGHIEVVSDNRNSMCKDSTNTRLELSESISGNQSNAGDFSSQNQNETNDSPLCYHINSADSFQNQDGTDSSAPSYHSNVQDPLYGNQRYPVISPVTIPDLINTNEFADFTNEKAAFLPNEWQSSDIRMNERDFINSTLALDLKNINDMKGNGYQSITNQDENVLDLPHMNVIDTPPDLKINVSNISNDPKDILSEKSVPDTPSDLENKILDITNGTKNILSEESVLDAPSDLNNNASDISNEPKDIRSEKGVLDAPLDLNNNASDISNEPKDIRSEENLSELSDDSTNENLSSAINGRNGHILDPKQLPFFSCCVYGLILPLLESKSFLNDFFKALSKSDTFRHRKALVYFILMRKLPNTLIDFLLQDTAVSVCFEAIDCLSFYQTDFLKYFLHYLSNSTFNRCAVKIFPYLETDLKNKYAMDICSIKSWNVRWAFCQILRDCWYDLHSLVLKKIVSTLLRDECSVVRKEVACLIEYVGLGDVLEFLEVVLEDSDYSVRENGLNALLQAILRDRALNTGNRSYDTSDGSSILRSNVLSNGSMSDSLSGVCLDDTSSKSLLGSSGLSVPSTLELGSISQSDSSIRLFLGDGQSKGLNPSDLPGSQNHIRLITEDSQLNSLGPSNLPGSQNHIRLISEDSQLNSLEPSNLPGSQNHIRSCPEDGQSESLGPEDLPGSQGQSHRPKRASLEKTPPSVSLVDSDTLSIFDRIESLLSKAIHDESDAVRLKIVEISLHMRAPYMNNLRDGKFPEDEQSTTKRSPINLHRNDIISKDDVCLQDRLPSLIGSQPSGIISEDAELTPGLDGSSTGDKNLNFYKITEQCKSDITSPTLTTSSENNQNISRFDNNSSSIYNGSSFFNESGIFNESVLLNLSSSQIQVPEYIIQIIQNLQSCQTWRTRLSLISLAMKLPLHFVTLFDLKKGLNDEIFSVRKATVKLIASVLKDFNNQDKRECSKENHQSLRSDPYEGDYFNNQELVADEGSKVNDRELIAFGGSKVNNQEFIQNQNIHQSDQKFIQNKSIHPNDQEFARNLSILSNHHDFIQTEGSRLNNQENTQNEDCQQGFYQQKDESRDQRNLDRRSDQIHPFLHLCRTTIIDTLGNSPYTHRVSLLYLLNSFTEVTDSVFDTFCIQILDIMKNDAVHNFRLCLLCKLRELSFFGKQKDTIDDIISYLEKSIQ